ncbi:MAG: PIN domain-containing protein [Candidatus Omnitrophica bacterium]|nr:PIN domain-containing protein [Candidatus Omnitrophota bacterium]
MALRYLLDSVILIDVLNGMDSAVKWMSRLNRGEAAISVITVAEVLSGAAEGEVDLVDELFARFDIIGIDERTARKAAELRVAEHWKLPDAFQAAIANGNGLKLVTRNTKDFPPRKYSFVLIPYHS